MHKFYWIQRLKNWQCMQSIAKVCCNIFILLWQGGDKCLLLDVLLSPSHQDKFATGWSVLWFNVTVDFFKFFAFFYCLSSLLVRSHQPNIFIVKFLVQGCNNVTRVRVKLEICNSSRRKKRCFRPHSHAADRDSKKQLFSSVFVF